MSVLKDYKCETHGYFEAWEPKCPMKQCNAEVMVVFLQAPGLKSYGGLFTGAGTQIRQNQGN